MRTVLILGASSDIGLAVCRRYLDAGWRVISHFRTHRPELEAFKGQAFEPWQFDLAETAKLERALADNADFFLRADAVVNLAAELKPLRFEQFSGSEVLATLAVNLLPGLLVMRTVGPAMAERGFGRIVHASSIGVRFGGGGDTFAYSLSKHAQEFIPRTARQWAEKNVFVNVLRVGVTDTRIHSKVPGKAMQDRIHLIPAKRAARTDEIAEAFFWFGSEANGFTTGQVVGVAGGE